MHARFGKLPWSDLFQSAIAYSEHGFPVSEIVQELWAAPGTDRQAAAFPETGRVFLPNGRPPEQGDLFRNPDLARGLSA